MTISLALVTGGNGFIGSNLCRILRAADIPVRALVLPGEKVDGLTALGVEVVRGDITQPLAAATFAGVSHVFHLAALPFDWGPYELFERVNVQGTRHVLDGAIAAGVPRFLHVSSLAVHAYTGHAAGDENTPRDADINAYAITKREAEEVVLARREATHVTLVRPGVCPYGPGDRLSLPGIVEALDKGIYRHVGGGHTRVCLSYVDNLVTGMMQAVQRDGASGEAFVLCDDVVSWRDFVTAIAREFGRPVPTGSLPFGLAWAAAIALETVYRLLPLKGAPALTRYRISLFRGDLVFSSDKAREAFGYRPAIGLQEGLRHTRQWLQENGIVKA